MESKSVQPPPLPFSPSHPVAPLPLPLTPSRRSRRGRKLCRWRRKALINTTVSDRYADPRHCKMAAISPSHSSDHQPSPRPHHSPAPATPVYWTPEGVSASHSPPALPAGTLISCSSAARAPDFHTPVAAATASPHQVERVEVRTLPPVRDARLMRLRRVVPPGIYMHRDFIGRSWCR